MDYLSERVYEFFLSKTIQDLIDIKDGHRQHDLRRNLVIRCYLEVKVLPRWIDVPELLAEDSSIIVPAELKTQLPLQSIM